MRRLILSILAITTMLLVPSPSARAAPANDACASPSIIASLPFSDAIETTDATTDVADPQLCGTGDPGTHSVWYAFTPATGGTLYAATFTSDYDTALAAYSGDCATLTPIVCNDDFADGHTSYVSFAVEAGVPVLIEVAGSPQADITHDNGTLQLSVDLIPDKNAGKAVEKCQKTLKKTGAGFALAALKSFDKCTSALFKCLQLTGGDPTCFTKDCNDCHAKLPTACRDCHDFPVSKDPFAKLAAGDESTCRPVSFAQIMKTTGIGYELRETECTDLLGSITTVSDIGYCTALQHDCQAATLFGTAVPRARELIAMCDDVPFELECLPDHGIGGNLADAATAKAVTKCQAGIVKAATKLASATLKSLESCVALTFGCIAAKGADLKCLNGNKAVTGKTGGADLKCDKGQAKIVAARGKLGPAIDKACGAIPFATLKSADAANVGALASECAALGVPALDTLADYEECLARQQVCFAEDLLRFEAPRGEGLLPLVKPMPELDDSFCPSPLVEP